MPCDEDDGEFPFGRYKLTLKIKTAFAWQSDIEHQASGAIGRNGSEKLGNGRE